jgi:hypothetical protein
MNNTNLSAKVSMELLSLQRPKLDLIKNENSDLKINKFKFIESESKRYLDIEYLTDIIKKRSYNMTGKMRFKIEIGKMVLKICYAIILIVLLAITVTAQELTTGSGAEFSLGSSTLILSGDWVNDGTFNAEDGEVIFNGADGNQSITGNEIEFNNLTVNKTSGTLNLKNSIIVKGTLSIISGIINGNNHTVTLGSNALLNETGGNTIAEGVITTTRTLNAPTGVNILGVVITSNSNLGTTTITRGHAPQSGQGNTGILRYYDIIPANNSNLNATLVFNYTDSELNGLSEEGLTLFHSTDNGTAKREK